MEQTLCYEYGGTPVSLHYWIAQVEWSYTRRREMKNSEHGLSVQKKLNGKGVTQEIVTQEEKQTSMTGVQEHEKTWIANK